MNKKCILFSILSICFISSCIDDEIPNIDHAKSYKDSSSVTRILLSSDSIAIKHDMQSNPELILADRIIYKNSMYVLDLSAKDASDLLIPEKTYQKYVKKVDEMNNAAIKFK